MAQHRRGFLAVFLAVVGIMMLAAGGCGGKPAETSTAPTTAAASERMVDEAYVDQMEGDEFQQVAGEAAGRLVDRHGGDEGAFLATLLALDQGYDVYQLLSGALGDRLEADGRITNADGSPLSPARQPEGAIELAASKPILVASLSAPLLVADSPPSPADAVISTGGVTVTVDEVFQKVLDRKKQALEEAEDGTVAAGSEEWLRGYVTYWTILLAARGYSATQIVQGLVMRAERYELPDLVPDSGPGTDEYLCAYIWHSSGVMLKPKYPPVDPIQEMVCPVAPKDAPELFVNEEVRKAVAGGSGGGSGGGGSTAAIDLTGRWVGTITAKKATVAGQDVSSYAGEGCDPSVIYTMSFPVIADVVMNTDGTGTANWSGQPVEVPGTSGGVITLNSSGGPMQWTWQDGVVGIVVKADDGEVVLHGEPRVLEDGTTVVEGIYSGSSTGTIGDESFDLDANGDFTFTKQAD